MSKFLIEIDSPDGPVTKEEIRKCLNWLMNHDGVAWRGMYRVEEIQRDHRLPPDDYCDCVTNNRKFTDYYNNFLYTPARLTHSKCGKTAKPGTVIYV